MNAQPVFAIERFVLAVACRIVAEKDPGGAVLVAYAIVACAVDAVIPVPLRRCRRPRPRPCRPRRSCARGLALGLAATGWRFLDCDFGTWVAGACRGRDIF